MHHSRKSGFVSSGSHVLVEGAPDRHTRAVKNQDRYIALCAIGLEKICAAELDRLGFGCVERNPGMIVFEAPDLDQGAALARANLRLRTAERVLVQPGHFPARDFGEFFDGVASMPWERWLRRDARVVIERVRTRDSALASQTSLQSLAQKAIYDRMMKTHRIGRMAETGGTVSLRVYLDRDMARIGLDTSGDALHKRGYRLSGGPAPLKETLAAGLLFMAGWARRLALHDPFCGSGSIAIEAALYATDRAPGLVRHFAFETMPFCDARSVAAEREAAEAAVRRDVRVRILATDSDAAAIEAARSNARRAGVESLIEFARADARDAAPRDGEGILLANPPYGQRLGTPEEAHALYASLSGMRDRYRDSGWGMGFITNGPDFPEHFGARPAHSRKVVNGAEEQYFHWYPALPERRGLS